MSNVILGSRISSWLLQISRFLVLYLYNSQGPWHVLIHRMTYASSGEVHLPKGCIAYNEIHHAAWEWVGEDGQSACKHIQVGHQKVNHDPHGDGHVSLVWNNHASVNSQSLFIQLIWLEVETLLNYTDMHRLYCVRDDIIWDIHTFNMIAWGFTARFVTQLWYCTFVVHVVYHVGGTPKRSNAGCGAQGPEASFRGAGGSSPQGKRKKENKRKKERKKKKKEKEKRKKEKKERRELWIASNYYI